MSYQWNWSVFAQETVVGDGSTYAGWMLAGLKMTVTVSLCAWVLALVMGAIVGEFQEAFRRARDFDQARESLGQLGELHRRPGMQAHVMGDHH